MLHELKTWTDSFDAIYQGNKTHEIRRDDRGFGAGDTLHLREWVPAEGDKAGGYTGRALYVHVTFCSPLRATLNKYYQFTGAPAELDFCVMSVRKLTDDELQKLVQDSNLPPSQPPTTAREDITIETALPKKE